MNTAQPAPFRAKHHDAAPMAQAKNAAADLAVFFQLMSRDAERARDFAMDIDAALDAGNVEQITAALQELRCRCDRIVSGLRTISQSKFIDANLSPLLKAQAV